jgi:hypothetical protein
LFRVAHEGEWDRISGSKKTLYKKLRVLKNQSIIQVFSEKADIS